MMTDLHFTPDELRTMLDDSSHASFGTLFNPIAWKRREDAINWMRKNSRKLTEDLLALHEQLRWRPIETAPKYIEFRCLLAHRCSVVTGYWNGETWINERSVCRSTFKATHWMPLPQPPQENE